MKYNSQYKQDYIIDYILKGKRNGTFLECGAHDGIKHSNTLFFENERNWKGICIEPIPEVFKKLERNRTCYKVNGALSNKNGKLKFKRLHGYTEQLSGAVKFLQEEHEIRTKRDIEKHGGDFEIIEVIGYKVSDILDRFSINELDYFSLDIEGGEYEILETLDFQKYQVRCITVENNFKCSKIRQLMRQKGFSLILNHGADDFYIQKEYYNIVHFLSNKKILFLCIIFKLKKLKYRVKGYRFLKKLLYTKKIIFLKT